MSKFILDTTVWLNFARGDAVDLLVGGFSGKLVVGMIVRRREMRTWPRTTARADEPFSFDAFVESGMVEYAEMSVDELARFSAIRSSLRLGEGETEAFVLATSRGWTMATDDGAARKRISSDPAAPPLSGTIGLLRMLVNLGAIGKEAASAILKVMRERKGRLPDEDI